MKWFGWDLPNKIFWRRPRCFFRGSSSKVSAIAADLKEHACDTAIARREFWTGAMPASGLVAAFPNKLCRWFIQPRFFAAPG